MNRRSLCTQQNRTHKITKRWPYHIIGYACRQRADQTSIFLAFVMEVL